MQDIVIFGIGKIGKDIILHLEKKYKIRFLIDNDKEKWGRFLGNYVIKSPCAIQSCDCHVVIASVKYGMEMVAQLHDMQIDEDRIYLCRRYQTYKSYRYDIYPFDIQKLIGTGKNLKEYDLLDVTDCGKCPIKVMVFCTFYSVYAKQLIENMSRRYDCIEFSLITNERKYQKSLKAERLKHLYYFQTMAELKTILESLPEYSAMQFLWIEREWSYFYSILRKKTKYLNLNVGGSDFYRATAAERDYKKNLIKCADRVTAETVGTIRDFELYYKENVKNKISLLPFGIEVLDFIKLIGNKDKSNIKKKYHVPLDKCIVTCGHNAIEEHQHMQIINALAGLPQSVKEKIVCVFPMTYPSGKDEYISKVNEELEKAGFDYVVLTEFMNFWDMAEYAFISDIMIHVQTTDQLSSTMLEEMYAGSVIIAGSWLPYQSLHEMGMYFLDVDAISDVADVLLDVVMNLETYKEKCAGNSEIVWNHSSWDALAPRWRALWD